MVVYWREYFCWEEESTRMNACMRRVDWLSLACSAGLGVAWGIVVDDVFSVLLYGSIPGVPGSPRFMNLA